MASMQRTLDEMRFRVTEQASILTGIAKRGGSFEFVLKETDKALDSVEDLVEYETITNGGLHPETKRAKGRLTKLKDIITRRQQEAKT